MKRKLYSAFLSFAVLLLLMPFSTIPAYAAANHTHYSQNGWKYNGKQLDSLCYATCIAMSLSDLGKSVTPLDIYINNGYTPNCKDNTATAKDYGVSWSRIVTDAGRFSVAEKEAIIKQSLETGNYPQGIMLYGGGHMVLARKVVNGTIYFDDPAIGCCIPIEKCNRITYSNITLIAYFSAKRPTGSSGISSPTNIPTVKSTETGKWTVKIPANYKLVCYDIASATRSSTYYMAAQTKSYTLTCTQKATLSNGKTRYFFISGDNKNLWFDYTSGMSVVPGTSTDVKSYTVTFDANGGSVGPRTKMVVAGNSIGSMPTPVRAGYIFLGWCTEKEGSGLVVNEYNFTVNQNQTLYALWKMEQTLAYAVTFNPNGGSVSQSSKSVTSGQKYGTLPTPSRNGYTFDGWFTSANGGTQITAATTVNLTGNQTLFAHWSEDKQTYTLYFDPDGGSVDITSNKITYGEYYGELPTPYREGYKFEGWYSGRNGTGSLRWPVIYVTTKSDETVYAHWSLIDTRIRVHFDTNGGPDHSYLSYYESNDTYGNLPSTEWAGYRMVYRADWRNQNLFYNKIDPGF